MHNIVILCCGSSTWRIDIGFQWHTKSLWYKNLELLWHFNKWFASMNRMINLPKIGEILTWISLFLCKLLANCSFVESVSEICLDIYWLWLKWLKIKYSLYKKEKSQIWVQFWFFWSLTHWFYSLVCKRWKVSLSSQNHTFKHGTKWAASKYSLKNKQTNKANNGIKKLKGPIFSIAEITYFW